MKHRLPPMIIMLDEDNVSYLVHILEELRSGNPDNLLFDATRCAMLLEEIHYFEEKHAELYPDPSKDYEKPAKGEK